MFYRRTPVSSGVNYKSESAPVLSFANERLDDAGVSRLCRLRDRAVFRAQDYFVSVGNRFEYRHRLARLEFLLTLQVFQLPRRFSLCFSIFCDFPFDIVRLPRDT